MKFIGFLIVFVITYNQGAARAVNGELNFVTRNGLDNPDSTASETKYLFPTIVTRNLITTIKGTLNINGKTLVTLRSSSSEICQIKYDYEKGNFSVTPGHESDIFNFSDEAIAFSLELKPRVIENSGEMFSVILSRNGDGESTLICNVQKLEDIKYIVINDGVARVDSLLFKFNEK